MPPNSDSSFSSVRRIAICGVGLIGGSILRKLRASKFQGRIDGLDIDHELLGHLRTQGWIDEIAEQGGDLFDRYDLIVLCQPVGAVIDFIETYAEHIADGRAVCLDVGSVKSPMVEILKGSRSIRRFVPSHPIAGKATYGWDTSEAGLFLDKRCIITPTENTDPAAVSCAREFWQLMGAHVESMPAPIHDAIYAAMSHLPQLLTYAYLHSLAMRPETRDWINYQGTGFEGFSRLGGSAPALWADIAINNRSSIIKEIDLLSDSLAMIRNQILETRIDALRQIFQAARSLHMTSIIN